MSNKEENVENKCKHRFSYEGHIGETEIALYKCLYCDKETEIEVGKRRGDVLYLDMEEKEECDNKLNKELK